MARKSEHITITISTASEAFDAFPAMAIAKVLRDLADSFEDYGVPPSEILDPHGDFCGEVKILQYNA